MDKLHVTVEDYPDIPDPSGESMWRLHSFSRSHKHYTNPVELQVVVDRDHVHEVCNRELQRKLEAGHAYWLSYFEHGECLWMRVGGPVPPGVEFKWDGVRYAGLLELQDKFNAAKFASVAEATASADAFLTEFNSWANGVGWYVVITGPSSDGLFDQIIASAAFYDCQLSQMCAMIAKCVRGKAYEITDIADGAIPELEQLVEQQLQKHQDNPPEAPNE